jgi:FtsH-binding integral membrane protein
LALSAVISDNLFVPGSELTSVPITIIAGLVTSLFSVVAINTTKYEIHTDLYPSTENKAENSGITAAQASISDETSKYKIKNPNLEHELEDIVGFHAKHHGKQTFDHLKFNSILYSTNSFPRNLAFLTAVVGHSFMLSPLFAVTGTKALFLATLSASTVFSGATLYSLSQPSEKLSKLGPAVLGGLSGFIGLGLLEMGSTWLYGGPTELSMFLHSVDVYLGIPFFAALVAYDTNQAIRYYKAGNPDHLGLSVRLYLDFLNIFVRMLEAMRTDQNK